MSKFERLMVIFDLIVCLAPFFGVAFYFSSDETRQIFIFSLAGIILSVIFACFLKLWWQSAKELYEVFNEWRRHDEK